MYMYYNLQLIKIVRCLLEILKLLGFVLKHCTLLKVKQFNINYIEQNIWLEAIWCWC